MKLTIKRERANQYADMIIEDKLSIREVAKECGVSKTTVHSYITKYTTGYIRKLRLRYQLNLNRDEWSKKGALATKIKYAKLRNGGE